MALSNWLVTLMLLIVWYIGYCYSGNNHTNLCTMQHIIYDESRAIESHQFYTQILSSTIPPSHNKEEATSKNYASETNRNDASKYAKIRNSNLIDMNYHNYYTPQRIKLQDDIIDLFINNDCNQQQIRNKNKNKWIIFFGGPIGVGKSYLIKQLSPKYIPELHYNHSIITNADLIRPLLPEYGLYNDKQKQIDFLHKEVGLICELILWASLENNNNQHIVFDSTLRHTLWFKWLFEIIISQYSQYKLAMIGVLPANMKQLKNQILKRNKESNRKTEWEFVERGIVDINKSLFQLKYLVDIAINITNPGILFENKENKEQFKIDIFCKSSQTTSSTNFAQNQSINLLNSFFTKGHQHQIHLIDIERTENMVSILVLLGSIILYIYLFSRILKEQKIHYTVNIYFATLIIRCLIEIIQMMHDGNGSNETYYFTIWFIRSAVSIIMELSWTYFLYIILEEKYEFPHQAAFLKIPKYIINILFRICYLSQINRTILAMIRYNKLLRVWYQLILPLWLPSLSNVDKKYYQWSVILYIMIQLIFTSVLLYLFNQKLYRYISFTFNNNQLLSAEINDKLMNKVIIKQTNLICIMLIVVVIYTVFDFVYWHFEFGNDLNWKIIYIILRGMNQMTITICIYLSFGHTQSCYDRLCCCADKLCRCILQRQISFATDNKNMYAVKGNDSGYTERENTCDYKEDCTVIDRIVEFLHHKPDELSSYKSTDIFNDFHHLLNHHDDKNNFNIIYKRLNKDNYQCNDAECIHFLRSNRRRLSTSKQQSIFNNDYDNIHDALLQNTYAKYHTYYYHSRTPKQINVDTLDEDDIMYPNKFASNIELDDVVNNVYSFGRRFLYYENKQNDDEEWLVSAKYNNLKDELVNNDNISMNIYNEEYNKAAYISTTEHIKKLQNRNIKEKLSIDCILSLLIYCNCDEYQKEWSSTFRLSSNESKESLKQRHSNFYWSSLYLIKITEQFGQICMYNKSKTFYRGINQIFYFDKTITKFNAPFSTSENRDIAERFCKGSGLILELTYKFSPYPLMAKYFQCEYLSDYPNEKEALFVGGIPMLIITNIINISNNNIENYRKYITAINHLNAIMNGTYKCNDERINIEVLFVLLAYMINEHKDNTYDIPKYIQTTLKQYCMKLKNIVISWENVFGRDGNDNLKLKQLLTHYRDDMDVFFDLNVLDKLFPNVEQIEYSIKMNEQNEIIKKIVNYIINEQNQIIKQYKLKYIVIYHTKTNINLKSIILNTSSNKWNACNYDENKIILYKDTDFHGKNIQFHFNQIQQGESTKYMLDNFNI